jgi:hypothetical protein
MASIVDFIALEVSENSSILSSIHANTLLDIINEELGL